jgi:ribosomal protein S18 acetylase RimI-like enzyme
VTAGNEGAVELYRSMGFEVVQELYRDGSTGEVIPEDEARLGYPRWSRSGGR